MRRRGRFAATVFVLLLLVVSGGTVFVFSNLHAAPYTPLAASNIPMEQLTRAIPDSAPNAQQVRLGQYLVRAGDCAACHTAQNGAFLAGSFALNSPFGTIYSTNLTSDAETGIGKVTPEQFYDALHNGNGSHGALYPAMPYPYTTRLTRADSDAILAFLKTVLPVKQAPPPNRLDFPFNIRSLVHGWNLLYFRRGEFVADASKSADWNRGAYLVEGVGHCGACHTPKNQLAGDERDKPLYGGMLDNWVAPDLTGNARTGLGRWALADVVEYLRTGRNKFANAGGSMAEVVTRSTSLLSDADLQAIATYLKDRAASPDVASGTPDAAVMKRGAAIYSDACTACHMEQGVGQPGFFPPLANNSVSQQADPTGVLHIILAGDRTAATAKRPTALSMPSFAWKLNDQQVADVATYLRNSQGNRASAISVQQVAALRKSLGLETVHLTDNSTDR
jgi:mono/diheme cytochrome c family protein